jgi:hypothetical protein
MIILLITTTYLILSYCTVMGFCRVAREMGEDD